MLERGLALQLKWPQMHQAAIGQRAGGGTYNVLICVCACLNDGVFCKCSFSMFVEHGRALAAKIPYDCFAAVLPFFVVFGISTPPFARACA